MRGRHVVTAINTLLVDNIRNMCIPGGRKTVDKTVYNARLQINTDKNMFIQVDSSRSVPVHETELFKRRHCDLYLPRHNSTLVLSQSKDFQCIWVMVIECNINIL